MKRMLAVLAFLGTLGVEVHAEDAAEALAPRRTAFGTSDYSILNIPAAAFVTRDSTITWVYSGDGYIYQTGNVVEPFWAPVDLPTGAVVDGIGLYFDDTNADHDMTATLRVYTGGTNNNADFIDVVNTTSLEADSQHYHFVVVDQPHTVRNDILAGGGMYTIVILTPVSGPTLAFKGVDLAWHRQVSPAPGAATFNDVPIDHAFFQFVEALAASGITAGCGNGGYCPDAPLTRGQMAVFLAKALGLHWPH